jgi:hypothetical protein
MNDPTPSFAHIVAMSDERGTFEHADHTTPRRQHGYCTDDMARLLVVTTRELDPDAVVRGLARMAFRFVADAQGVTGTTRNRMTSGGRWTGQRSVEDCWGRSMWGFGTAAARGGEGWLRQDALAYFNRGAEQRSPWPRAMAFASLGAVEILAVDPAHRRATDLLDDAAAVIGRSRPTGADWPWPEARLTYANAVLPDALMAIGAARNRPDLVEEGLFLLEWLITRQTNGDHLSFVPVGGAGPGDPGACFDQQPIEAATLADACARAAVLTGASSWAGHLRRTIDWFLGDNDSSASMIDVTSGGGYDGLRADGPNLNEGAESTLAMISALQHARQLVAVPQ